MRRIALSAFVFCMAGAFGALAAQQLPPGWIADPTTGCRVWDNFPLPDDRAEWAGPCVNGYAEGVGTLKWFSKGANYEIDAGQFAAGKMQGHGTSDEVSSGEHFEGEFDQNRPNGFGTLTNKSTGQVYSGTWVNGCFNDGVRKAHFWQTAEACGN
ncbi:MAG: hypothetical protein ABSC62_11730 [Terracidiphilus sp.]|jgi:hypothetical protein